MSDFGELSDGGSAGGVPGNAVVGGDDPSFASTFVNNPSQGLDHLSLGVIGQQGGGTLLGSTLGMVSSGMDTGMGGEGGGVVVWKVVV